jgi:hypothetical protein
MQMSSPPHRHPLANDDEEGIGGQTAAETHGTQIKSAHEEYKFTFNRMMMPAERTPGTRSSTARQCRYVFDETPVNSVSWRGRERERGEPWANADTRVTHLGKPHDSVETLLLFLSEIIVQLVQEYNVLCYCLKIFDPAYKNPRI